MHRAIQRRFLTPALCFLAILPVAAASGCSEKDGSQKQEKARHPVTRPKQPPDLAAKVPQKLEATSVQTDAGTVPTAKSASQKKRLDTKDAEVTVALKAIYVSKERKNVDPRIKEIATLLTKEFNEYELTNFVLLDAKELKLSPSQSVPVQLPGDRRLEITNRGVRDKKVVLGLEMAKFIKTTVSLSQKGKITLGGPKYKFGKGMIVLFIKARPTEQ